MLRAFCLAFALAPAVAAAAEPLADFAAAWRSAGAPVCRASEHALVLATRESALLDELDGPLRALDADLALRDAAPGLVAPMPEACRRAGLALAQDGAGATLSGALPDKLVLLLVEPGRAEPVRILGHVPRLADWAAGPFMQTAVLDAAALSGTDRTDGLSAALRMAADAGTSLRYFLAGRRREAVALRPAPDAMAPLPRAWLSGIPLRDGSRGDGFLDDERDLAFDAFVEPGDGSVLDSLLDPAVPAGAAAASSAPAMRASCRGEDGDTRWAGFVAGYWRAAAEERDFFGFDGFVPAGPLAPRPADLFENGESCLDTTLYRLLSGGTDRATPPQVLLDRLDAVAWAEFGTGEGGARRDARRRLAREILAALLAAARMDWLAENGGNVADPYFPTGLCTGPRTGDQQPVRDLIEAVAPFPGSPVAVPIVLAKGLPAGPDAAGALDALLAPPALDWIGGVPALRDTLAFEALRLWPAARHAVVARFTVPDERLTPGEAARLMRLSDALFNENAERIRRDFDSFDRQARLARILATTGWWSVVPALAADRLNAGGLYRQVVGLFADEAMSNRASFARFIGLFPELEPPAFRDRLFESSDANALRVGAIDLLEALAEIERGREDRVAEHRALWTRFAPTPDALPERPIHGAFSDGADAASLAALHRLTFALVAWLRADPADDPVAAAQAQLASAAGLLAVQIDLMRAQRAKEAPQSAYNPGPDARTIHAFLRDQIGGGAFSALLAAQETGTPDAPAEQWALIEAAWTAARPWVALAFSGDRDPSETDAWLIDAEVALRLAGALFDADRDRRWNAVEALHARLAEDRPWPPPLRRLAARIAGLAIEDDLPPEAIATEYEALLAEVDALAPLPTRQRLLDVGLFPAMLVGLPVRLLIEAHRAGGVDAIETDAVLAAAETEFDRLDFTAFAAAPGNRALMETLTAMARVESVTPAQMAALSSDPVAAVIERLRQWLRADPPAEPGPEARAMGALLAASVALNDATDPKAQNPEAGLMAARERFAEVAALCPNLDAALGPIRLDIARRLGTPPGHEAGLAALRRLVEDESDAGVVLVASNRLFAMAGVAAFRLHAPAEAATGRANGGLAFLFGARDPMEPGLGVWRVHSGIDLALDNHPTARAFALALGLAEDAAAEGAVSRLDMLLPLLETLLVGGDALPAFGAPARSDPMPYRSGLLAGTGMAVADPSGSDGAAPLEAPGGSGPGLLPATALTERPGERLMRLAAIAEAHGLSALALRTAGLGVAVLHERAALAGPEVDGSDDASFWRPDDPRADLSGGYPAAQRVAALLTPASRGLVDWALCGGDGTPVEDRRAAAICAIGDRFAGDAPLGDPIPDNPFLSAAHDVDAGLASGAPCDMLALAVLAGMPDAISPGAGSCRHGPLAADAEALTSLAAAPTLAAINDLLAGALARGFAPMVFHRDPGLFVDAVAAGAGAAAPEELAAAFERGAVLAGLLGRIDLAEAFGYRALLAGIAHGPDADSAERMLRWARSLAGIAHTPEVREMLTRLASPGAAPRVEDRALAARLLEDLRR